MASKTVRIFDKSNKDPKEAWFSTSLTDVNNKINNAGIPTNAVVSSMRIYVNADFDGGGLGSPKVYLQFGFGSSGNISYALMGDTQIAKDAYNYPSNTGASVSSTYIKTTSPFGFQSVGDFVMYIHTAHVLVTELTVNYAEVVVEYTIPTYTISTSVSPANTGTVSGGGTYNRGTSVKLTANPITGYEFAGWNDGNTDNPRTVTATGNLTYTATFRKRKFTISTGVSPSGSGTVTGGGTYEYGSKPTLTAVPNTGYRFVKWNDEVTTNPRTVTVSNTVTYTAYFEKLKYTATFKNWDGTVLKSETVEHGGTPTPPTNPTKPSDAQYTYSFSGWSSAVGAITSNTEYTAQFKSTLRKYTITFKNHDGTELQSSSLEYGKTPSYTGAAPTRSSTVQYDYSFSGWSPAITTVTGEATYIAQFNSTLRKYTVRWLNEDGTVLETDTTEYGKMPTYDKDDPTKPSTAQYSYKFAGWHIEVKAVEGNIDYKATYTETVNTYTVVWKNYDGAVLETDQKVPYGNIPTYDGVTPSKPSTDQYDYSFALWDTVVSQVTRDVVYTAVFNEIVRKYNITVTDAAEGKINGAVSGSYEYGTKLTLTATPNQGYHVDEWLFTGAVKEGTDIYSDTVTFEVIGNADISIKYEINTYLILWKNYDGTVLEEDTVEHGMVPQYDGEDPVKTPTVQYSYLFSGWGNQIIAATGPTVYIAVFDSIVNQYLLEGTADKGGTVTGGGIYDFGTLVTLTAVPDPGYVFSRWYDGDTSNPRTVTVYGEASYLAIFTAQNIYRSNDIFVRPYQGDNPNIEVYKGINKIYG